MPISATLAQERFSSGIYQDAADQLKSMGKASLAVAEYGTDFRRIIEGWSGNYAYKEDTGADFRTNIIGQVAPLSSGTIIVAKGNHYAGRAGDPFRPMDDDSKVKDVLVLELPPLAPNLLNALFYNQIGSLNAVRESDEEEETRDGIKVSVRDWVRNAAGDENSAKDHIVLHMLAKYGNLNKGKGGSKRVTKRTISDFTENGISSSTASSASESAGDEPLVRSGAFYDPHLNPDFGGSYFNLVNNKLVQLDVRGLENELIAPWMFADALKPGTLVLVNCSLHCYIMKDMKEGIPRKVYQINAHSVRVLDESDGDAIVPMMPTVPNQADPSPKEVSPAGPASDAFASFSIKRRKLNSGATKRYLPKDDNNGGRTDEKEGAGRALASNTESSVASKKTLKRKDGLKQKKKDDEEDEAMQQ
ncbi:hypothetical protein DXG01_010258 [Tephrocybe rancida]|nr:hypothetical protein DXG01_010258 [Tephrocybe rancida]